MLLRSEFHAFGQNVSLILDLKLVDTSPFDETLSFWVVEVRERYFEILAQTTDSAFPAEGIVYCYSSLDNLFNHTAADEICKATFCMYANKC